MFPKLYSAKVIRDNGIRFNEATQICEDVAFYREYMQHVKEIHLHSSSLYHHVQSQAPTLSNTRHRAEERMAASETMLRTNAALLQRLAITAPEYVDRQWTDFGLRQLYGAYIDAEWGNYRSVYAYIRSKKALFERHYVPLNAKQRAFKALFTAKRFAPLPTFILTRAFLAATGKM